MLGRYHQFKEATKARRQRLEDARKFMYFKRDADELESWILEKLQTASDENYKDPTNLQVSHVTRLAHMSSRGWLVGKCENESICGVANHLEIFLELRCCSY